MKSSKEIFVEAATGSKKLSCEQLRQIDLNQLRAAGTAGFDRHVRLTTPEMLCDEFEELFIRLAVHWWRLDLSDPCSVFLSFQQAGA
jgi:hypothetical protein